MSNQSEFPETWQPGDWFTVTPKSRTQWVIIGSSLQPNAWRARKVEPKYDERGNMLDVGLNPNVVIHYESRMVRANKITRGKEAAHAHRS